jgi:uncharacterized protein (TIGR03382 family)
MALLLTTSLVTAQDKDKDKDQPKKDGDKGVEVLPNPPRVKNKGPLVSGYTRPGYPNDVMEDGKLIQVAQKKDYKGRLLGGTVYYAVYERPDVGLVAGDTFGTGIANIDDAFREGRGGAGNFSPGFDTTARYLYVYQLVNDRGLDPPKGEIVFAAFNDPSTEPIITTTVKLLVEPQDITSWGHFKNMGFSAKVPDRSLKGNIIMVADGQPALTDIAFSSFPAVLAALPNHEYLSLSPAQNLGELKNNFQVNQSNLNLKQTKAFDQLTRLVADNDALPWQKNMVQVSNGGVDPFLVDIVPADTANPNNTTPALKDRQAANQSPITKTMPRAYLKVDWSKDKVVNLGEQSVIFGFTSNYPPVQEMVRIISKPKEAKAGAGGANGQVAFVEQGGEAEGPIQLVAAVDGVGPGAGAGQVVGPGTVPTPIPSRAATGGFGPVGGMGGQMPGGGGFPGGGGGFGGGGIPGFGTGAGSGGGSGGGTGGGGNTQGQSGSQQQNQTPSQNGNQNQFQDVSLNVINAQAQFQQQQQQQKQKQDQNQNNNCCCNNGNVVPEPAAIFLAVLGLPALVLVLRRRKVAQTQGCPG